MLHAKETVDWISKELKPTFDLVEKPLKINQKEAILLFIKTVVDSDRIQQTIIKPFFEMDTEENFQAYLQTLSDEQEITSQDQVLTELTKGSVIVVIKDYPLRCLLRVLDPLSKNRNGQFIY